MTREEILAMKPQELNEAVGLMVMGFTVIRDGKWAMKPGHQWVELPNYAGDIAAAWDVATSAGGLVVRHLDPINRWTARFGSSVVMAEAVPEAICKARLLATLETLEEQPMG